VDPANDAWQQVAAGTISGLIKPTGDTTFYWYNGQCADEVACENNTIWRTVDGVSESFAEQPNAAFSPDGQSYAWVETTEDPTLILYYNSTTEAAQDYLYLSGNSSVDLQWSPLSGNLVLLTVIRDDYTGKSADAQIFLVDRASMTEREFYAFPGMNPSVHWSADAGQLMLTSTLATDSGYQLYFRQMNLASGLFDTLDGALTVTSTDFITIDKLFWIFP
jgi:Tol biopolymer transport system component